MEKKKSGKIMKAEWKMWEMPGL